MPPVSLGMRPLWAVSSIAESDSGQVGRPAYFSSKTHTLSLWNTSATAALLFMRSGT